MSCVFSQLSQGPHSSPVGGFQAGLNTQWPKQGGMSSSCGADAVGLGRQLPCAAQAGPGLLPPLLCDLGVASFSGSLTVIGRQLQFQP